MSLVNDMLRDLDSRRRQVPGRELGAEKLIPATDFSTERRGFQFRKVMLSVLLVIGVLAIAALFVFDAGLPGNAPVPRPMAVISQPVAPAAVQERDMALEDAMIEEISRMAERVRELEARTLTLQQDSLPGQESSAASLAADTAATQHVQPATTPGAQTPFVSAPAATAAVAEWTPRTWDNTEAFVGNAAVSPSAPAAAQNFATGSQMPELGGPVASTLVRSASELSFRETDRLQVQQALELWQGNQRNDALQLLEEFATQNLEAHQSREMLAKLLMQQGDMLAAMNQADIGLAIAPDHSGYKKVKARAMMMAGVPRDAAELLRVRAPSVASDTEYHELLAAAQLAGQFYEDALRTYQGLTARDAGQARWWYGLGAAMDAMGRSFEAAQSYEKAVQLGGLNANLMQQSQQRIVAIRQN